MGTRENRGRVGDGSRERMEREVGVTVKRRVGSAREMQNQ